MDIVTRASKGSALTWAELDANLGVLVPAWENLIGEIATAGIANAPVDRLYKGLIYVHAFSATVLQEMTVIFHVPKRFLQGTLIYPHLHVTPSTVSTGDVDWHMNYIWANDYDDADIALGAPASDQVYGTPVDIFTIQTVAASHIDANIIVELGPLNIPALKGDAVLICRIYRDPLDVEDTYPDEIYVTNADLYYQAQGFGERRQMKHTHSDKLERWLGAEKVDALVKAYGGFYYPIALHGVPGNVRIMPGGDFTGEIKAGEYFTAQDGAAAVLKKIRTAADQKAKHNKALGILAEMIRVGDPRLASVGAFASIDAVITAFTSGKGQRTSFMKTGVASNAIGNSNDLWTRVGTPVAGSASSAAPGGRVPTSALAGALGFSNLGTANTGHYLNWALNASVINNSLLMYDRIFDVVKTMASTATQAVTGVPTRYQNQTAGAADYIGGNFCFPANPTTVLAATAHNWTVCQYTDQDGTATQSFQSVAGVSACVVGGVDLVAGQWFLPMASGDVGVKALTQMQCSASVATGTIDFVIGHPIAVNACPIANIACVDDGLYTSLNLAYVFDSACLSFLEWRKPATTATTYGGILTFVSE